MSQRLAALRDALNALTFEEALLFHEAHQRSPHAVKDLFADLPEEPAPAAWSAPAYTSVPLKYPLVAYFARSGGGVSKIAQIKEIRSITGLGLKEAKDLVEKLQVTDQHQAHVLRWYDNLNDAAQALHSCVAQGIQALAFNPANTHVLGADFPNLHG